MIKQYIRRDTLNNNRVRAGVMVAVKDDESNRVAIGYSKVAEKAQIDQVMGDGVPYGTLTHIVLLDDFNPTLADKVAVRRAKAVLNGRDVKFGPYVEEDIAEFRERAKRYFKDCDVIN